MKIAKFTLFNLCASASILSVSTALAATNPGSKLITLTATTSNSCVFDSSNSNPAIYMTPSYNAVDSFGSNGTAADGSVSIVVFCNSGTSITRTLAAGPGYEYTTSGSITSTSAPSVVFNLKLKKIGAITKVLRVRAWFTQQNNATVFPAEAALYPGAVKHVTTINAGYTAAKQFNVPKGSYLGQLIFSVSF